MILDTMILSELEVIRNPDSDITETVNVTIDKHDTSSKEPEERRIAVAATEYKEAYVAIYDWKEPDSETIVNTKSFIYTIPEDDRVDHSTSTAEYVTFFEALIHSVEESQEYKDLVQELGE